VSAAPNTNDAIWVAQCAQRDAVDPTVSAWVSASAGSGKTTVLTSRVLALMLAGVAPQRILCVTFTKAAAAEMSNRITQRLGKWVSLPDHDLNTDISALLLRNATADDERRARQLFARVLDAPGGLRIQTIHAFCQSLLRRFPIEAGISPQFELMDERSAAEALDQAREQTIVSAEPTARPDLAAAMSFLTGRVHETRFPEIVAALTFQRAKIERLFERHGGLNAKGLGAAIAALKKTLGLSDNESPELAIETACANNAIDVAALKRAIAALNKGSKTDQERAVVIATWIANPDQRVAQFDDYCAVYLTQEKELRKTLATKEACKADIDVLPIMQSEAARLATVHERLTRLMTAEATSALLTVALEILASYRRYKAQRSLLDYDDLIQIARRLLRTPGVAAWVLYKLDGGIDHILIDEAQDTNPEQWDIIGALTDEFFAGAGRFEDHAGETTIARTVFAVGDRKQSIYSFQGADPAGFEAWRTAFATKVGNVEQRWRDVNMNVSFRSTDSVLKAVDLTFSAIDAKDGVIAPSETMAHLVARDGMAGRVELWPPVVPQQTDVPPPWKPPVERTRSDSPQNRLAQLIAGRIARMVGAEKLPTRDRLIKAGDIMVLVRRRTGFVDELVRQLKARQIPVAGVDRMVLAQQLAVMDLIVLGQFLLLPSDDLTLATVLKSPLIGITEDQLFDLAYPRGNASLWDALCQHAGSSNVFGQAQKLLAELLDRADYLSPFALFSHVAVACDGRRKALGRLGFDADDPIDEFLNLALAYEKNHPPSLQAFLQWVQNGEIEIKRDLEQSGVDAVRIMTVHGAKGLQAPIVFMPDTSQVPTQRDALLWTEGENATLLWCVSSKNADALSVSLRDAAKAKQMQEYRRLLYVAMTRAEDQLYVCGWETKKATNDGNWYGLIRAGLERAAQKIADNFLEQQQITLGHDVLVLENHQAVPAKSDHVAATEVADLALPSWANALPPPERDPPQPLTPSRASRPEPAVISPLAEDSKLRFQRGLIIHRLLQTLPDVPPERHDAAASAFVSRPSWNLTAAQQKALVAETLLVLANPSFAALFAPGSLAEVPIVGLVGKHAVSGQVDRLAITATEVWIIDYKTNRPPPREAENVDAGYVFQLAVYRDVLRRIYPNHHVRCVLLWTDGPFAMELPAAMLDTALMNIAS